MKTRIQSLDAARGFTVLIMPAVHTVMLYGQPAVHHSWLGYLLAFLAEGPGAQLFMFLMGLSVVMARPKTTSQVLRRAMILLMAGYLLNIVRMVIPAQLHLLPAALLKDYMVYKNVPAAISLLLTGDILQFAAIAYVILLFTSRLKKAALTAVVLWFIVVILSPFLWGIQTNNLIANHLMGLFFADDFRAFFPVFPWLCYPLAGLAAGYYYKRIKPEHMSRYAFAAGIVLFAAGLAFTLIQPAAWDKDFYRAGPARSIFQTGFVLLWLSLAGVFTRRFEYSLFNRLLAFCSRHITAIYFIQWIVIAWGVGIAGYHRLGMMQSLLAVVLSSALTLAITWLISVRPYFFFRTVQTSN